MTSKINIYWDSDCFLGYLKEEQGKIELCEQVINEAENGRILLVTSALTLTEVIKMKGREPVDISDRKKIEISFQKSYLKILPVTRQIAESAREYIWHNNIGYKDAIHIATATNQNLEKFHTFDNLLINQSPLSYNNRKTLRITRPEPMERTLL